MPKFHPLKVREIRQETDECVSVSFEVPEALEEAFSFVPGQYLTLKTKLNEEEVRRSYSICTSPLDNDLRVSVKKVEGGLFSTYANEELAVGDTLEVMTPIGRFTTRIDENHEKQYLAFAAGSGITPVMSIMKTVLLREPKSQFCLFYGNKTSGSIIFKEEIEDLKNLFMDRLQVYYILSREQTESPILYGRIDHEKCSVILEEIIDVSTFDDAFLCGPAPMIESVTDQLQKAGMDKKHIHFELFASPKQLEERKVETKQKKKGSGLQSNVTIILDGLQTSFDMDREEDNILDAAMKNGADLPFACKGGVCATCRAHVDDGEVEMDINYALEEDEVERGFVLTCQAHPKSEKVTVNFDEV